MLNFFYKNMKNKKGFTLIELIIVVAILGILAAVAIPRFGNVTTTAKINTDVANAKIIADAVSLAISEGAMGESNGGDADTILVGTDNGLDGNKHHYLQAYPTPQYAPGAFVVTIDDNGGVTVSNTTSKDGTMPGSLKAETAYSLYPTKSADYK